MKSIKKNGFASKLTMAIAVCMALVGAGCTDQEPSDEPTAEISAEISAQLSPELLVELNEGRAKLVTKESLLKEDGNISLADPPVILSFLDTCYRGWAVVDAEGVARQAGADNCQRRGGGYRYQRTWGPARCWLNLSNCDGNIVCQSGCPL